MFIRSMITLAALAALTGLANGEALEGRLSSAEILAQSAPADWRALDPEQTLYIELERGRVIVALSSDLAQRQVDQIKALARAGFYDGLSFYRVIDGFVAQGGDGLETRDLPEGVSDALTAQFDEPYDKKMDATFLKYKDGYAGTVGFLGSLPVGVDKKKKSIWHLHCTGAIAMARDIEKDTASTEFYIPIQPQRYLDRNLSVFGRVVSGMEHVQALRRVSPPEKEGDDLGDPILSMRVAADVPAEARTALEILRDDTATFDAYAEARRNRPEDFFYHRPDYLDVCALAIPVREITTDAQ